MRKAIFAACIVCLLFSFASCKNNGQTATPSGKADASKVKKEASELKEEVKEPAVINVYVDNSASMSGYTEGNNAKFISAVSDMKSLVSGKGHARYWGINNHEIRDIANELAKHSFTGTETPFPKIFAKMARDSKGGNSLEFFITDGIIGVSDAAHLQNNLGAIKNEIRDSLRINPDVAVALLRLTSGYANQKGVYYTHQNAKVKLTNVTNRPFFVIAIGKKETVRWFIEKTKTDNSLEAYKAADLLSFGIHKHNAALRFSDFLNFEKKDGKASLKRGKKDFQLAAEMPECLINDLGADYIKNNLVVTRNGKDASTELAARIEGNTLILKCESPQNISDVQNEIKVKLSKKIPAKWKGWSCPDDSKIATSPMLQTQTFALEYLLNGMFEGTGDNNLLLLDATFEFKK